MSEPGQTQNSAADDALSVTGDATERSGRQDKSATAESTSDSPEQPSSPREIGGRDGLNPTRYGDWEFKGRCIDF
jgi:hypothetical protein